MYERASLLQPMVLPAGTELVIVDFFRSLEDVVGRVKKRFKNCEILGKGEFDGCYRVRIRTSKPYKRTYLAVLEEQLRWKIVIASEVLGHA